jgi:enoyl-CoA hydratase
MTINRRNLILAASGAVGATIVGDRAALAQTPPPAGSPLPPGGVVLERLEGGVLLIGIDRPEAQNRLDAAALIAIGKALYQLEHDEALRVGVLYGRGPDFVAGLDVPAFVAAQRAGTFPPKDPDYIQPLNLPPRRTKPLVVALHGQTGFVGHELALSADVRIAASNTRFLQAEVTRGVFPAGGATVRFTREAGWGNAMRYMLTGDGWDAAEAYRMGLVQEVVPPGRELTRAVELAKKIAAASPDGVQATLASANAGLAADERAAYAALPPTFARLLQKRGQR